MSAIRISVALALAALLVASCGDDGNVPIATPAGTGSCLRDQVEGCVLVGLVLDPPLALGDALAIAPDLGGEAIAVFRTDAVCVPSVMFTPAEEQEMEASRFAYVDAGEIATRRMDTVSRGLAPPITGLHISQSYWDQWESEWQQAQDDGVLIEGIAVYLPDGGREAALTDGRVTAVEDLASRRTDSLDPDYPGELLLDGRYFPGLSTTEPIDCG